MSTAPKTTSKGKRPKVASQKKLDQTLRVLKQALRENQPDAASNADQSEEDEPISRSAKKRQSDAVQALGERLVELPAYRLAQLPMDESLRQAIEEAAKITNHEGRRRQLQYVGKLMRSANVDLIAAELDQNSQKNRAAIGVEHAAERWRERLIADASAVTLWNDSYPDSPISEEDLIKMRDFKLNDSTVGKRRYRDLFRHIKAALVERSNN